jgi:hypothetical protein
MNTSSLEFFIDQLSQAERTLLDGLATPSQIQAYLDDIPYSAENANRCVLNVLRDRVAHCLDGALFAAAVLRLHGYPPLIMDLLPEEGTDDDHVLAIFKKDGYFGSVAKSNFVGLRFREAVYASPRELALSYFADYFNVYGQKTLRAYSRIINLSAYDSAGWMWQDTGVDFIEQRLFKLERITLIKPNIASGLSTVDPITYKAGMSIANPDGLYQPGKPSHARK